MEVKLCKRCSAEFNKPKKLSKKQWEGRAFCSHKCAATRLNIDLDKLKEMYIYDRLSSTEIAKIINTSPTHVIRLLKGFNVEIRGASESKSLALSRPEVREKMRIARVGKKLSESAKEKLRSITGELNANWLGGITMSNGYMCFTSSKSNGDNSGKALHTLIAEWLYKRKIKKGEHVHHIDGNKLNNSPENLTILSASDHMSLHMKKGIK